MQPIPCMASKWADEYSDMQDAWEVQFEDAADALIANPMLATDLAFMLAESDGIDTDDWTTEQWDDFVSDRWDELVEMYLEDR